MTRRHACFAGAVTMILAAVGTGLAHAQAQPAAAATASGSPAVRTLYVEIPSAGNAVSNA